MSLFKTKSNRSTKKWEFVKEVDNFAYFIRQNEVEITTNFNIKAGEEMFADYGEDHGGDGGGESN